MCLETVDDMKKILLKAKFIKLLGKWRSILTFHRAVDLFMQRAGYRKPRKVAPDSGSFSSCQEVFFVLR